MLKLGRFQARHVGKPRWSAYYCAASSGTVVLLIAAVLVIISLGCDTASITRDDSDLPKESQTSTPEYFFGLKVEPSVDELGRQVPFRSADENGFPLVPGEYRMVPIWNQNVFNIWPEDILKWENHINNFVLMDKVLIKLWNQGDHDFIAASITSSRRVYPHYPKTIYVRWKERIDRNGVKRRYIGLAAGGGDVRLTNEQIRMGIIPPGIRVLDYDSGGYDAYQFLTQVELNAGCGSEVGGVLVRCVDFGNSM